jgi:uncharacterized iron-regulated protein
MTTRTPIVLLLALAHAALLGCAYPSTPFERPPRPAEAAPTGSDAEWPTDPRALPMVEGRSGSPVSWADLVDRAAHADAVLIGEQHGHPMGLAMATALFDDMLAARPGQGAIAFEFFERDDQLAIDDYVAGIIDEDTFKERTGRTERNYVGHRDMLEAAKEAGIPIIAANAPRRYVRLARTDGYDRLRAMTYEQRDHFVIPDSLPDGPYKRRFFELMGGMAGHGDDSEGERTLEDLYADESLSAIFRSQSVWDATMADSTANLIEAGFTPTTLVVGQFHVDFEGGTLVRLRERLGRKTEILVVSVESVESRALRQEDIGKSDIVVYVGDRGE